MLASISGELKSCFTDGIHGGRCSLITAALHVLLGTDCKARHPPTHHHPTSIWGCLEYSVVKISRQMQISHSANTIAQSYKCHCHFFFFHFLILLPTTNRGRPESFLPVTVNSTAATEVLFWSLAFVAVCLQKTINRLLDWWIFFPPPLGLIVRGSCFVMVQISYHMLYKCPL